MVPVNTEEIILEAAEKIFLEKGFDGARMQEIADLAGINKALLHYYYKSKDNLYHTVFTKLAKAFFLNVFQKIDMNVPLDFFIKNFIDNYLDNLLQRRSILRFMLWELENGGANLNALFSQVIPGGMVLERFPLYVRIMNAINNKEIRDLDPKMLVINIIGMCIYPFIAHKVINVLWKEYDPCDPVMIEIRKKEIFDLVWNGIKRSEV